MTTVSVLQPGYLPWLGFFDQLAAADIFILYDDVQFDKHGWRNRNRVKCAHGAQWLTVPVRHHGRPRIDAVEIDDARPWARKHVSTLRQCYATAAYLDPYADELADVLSGAWRLLVDLDEEVIRLFAGWLGITTPVVRSSTLGITGERSERLVRLCKHFGASRYRSGDAARAYLDLRVFDREGIEVEWQNFEHPAYPQLHGPFVSHLSVIDLVFNCGHLSLSVLTGEGCP